MISLDNWKNWSDYKSFSEILANKILKIIVIDFRA